MIRHITLAATFGAFAMLASCRTPSASSAALKDADGDLPSGGKYCFHSAVRAALSAAVRDFSKKEVKDWDDAKGGGVSIDFDPDKIKDNDNGDVRRKIKDEGELGENDGDELMYAKYTIKVAYKSSDRKVKVSARFDTSECGDKKIDADPKGKNTDDELDDSGKCSVSAMRELIAWGIRNQVSDKDIDQWQKLRGKDLIKVTKFKRESGEDGLFYKGKVTGSHGDHDIEVEFGDDCRVKDVSKEIPDYGYDN